MKSIKIILTPSEVHDFRWFLEKCITLGPFLQYDLHPLHFVTTANSNRVSITDKQVFNLPMTVIAEFSEKVLPKLYFQSDRQCLKRITLKKSEAIAIKFIIENRPLLYIDDNECFISVQTIWLLQVGKYL